MKSLIYPSVLFCIVMVIMSCTKSALVDTHKPPVTDPGPKSCDSAKSINYALTNLTGISGYVIAFSGPQNYTFNFPANGTTTVSVKTGNYSVAVYAPGNYSQHSFHLNDQEIVEESGAKFESVILTPCTAPQSLEITQ